MHHGFTGQILAEAFPAQYRTLAVSAGTAVARVLSGQQRFERFSVLSEGQPVHVPTRLHFNPDLLAVPDMHEALPFTSALQTRSGDGYERQRAVRDLLPNMQPWAAPFIVALIGEYIVEILEDIHDALTADKIQMLAVFVIQNRAYWSVTKARVASYWNEYYRARWITEQGRAELRQEYVGFRLIEQIERAVTGSEKNLAE